MVVEAAISAGLSINEIARDESWRDLIRGSRYVFWGNLTTRLSLAQIAMHILYDLASSFNATNIYVYLFTFFSYILPY